MILALIYILKTLLKEFIYQSFVNKNNKINFEFQTDLQILFIGG